MKDLEDLIKKYRKEMKDLRGDTLVSMTEGIANERVASWIEKTLLPDLVELQKAKTPPDKERLPSNVHLYEGLLCIHTDGDNDSALYLSSLQEPLARELCWIRGKNISMRYWISDKPMTKDEAICATLDALEGIGDTEYCSRYSDLTGYLWTDENLKVGGHDIMKAFRQNVGKWLILEIET